MGRYATYVTCFLVECETDSEAHVCQRETGDQVDVD